MDPSSCSICSRLGDLHRGFQKRGREAEDTFLPDAASLLGPPRELQPERNPHVHLRRCPECGTSYLFTTESEFLVGGSEDEQELLRLSDEEAAAWAKKGGLD